MPPNFELHTPYKPTVFHEIQDDNKDSITSLLYNFVNSQNPGLKTDSSAKPKRRKKKLRERRTNGLPNREMSGQDALSTQFPMTVGFNSTTRHLEGLAALSAPLALSVLPGSNLEEGDTNEGCQFPHLDIVFITQPPDHLAFAHLPILAVTASAANPDLPQTRLVSISQEAEKKLSDVLNIPRVGMLGIKHGAAESQILVDLVQQVIPPIEVLWISQAAKGEYCGTTAAIAESSR